MRRLILLLLLSALCFPCFAQQDEAVVKLAVEVRDSDSRQPLADVMCCVVSPAGRLQSYKIADGRGHLSFTAGKADVLVFSLMGYGRRKVSVADLRQHGSQPAVILLSPKQIALKEVVVKLPPIRKQGDTLVYNVGSFLQKGDRHLEDVLRKLPGIKVAENGSVSYQGRAINRFYIEGQDLMGNNYTQATRNMPVNAVRDVEVLENHQPVKLLQGRKPSESAALNIRLDKGHRARPFGEIAGGAGIKPDIWDNRLFLTQVMKRSQTLVSAKMSNTGKDLSGETNEQINVYELEAYEPLPLGVLSGIISRETLPQERYLHNKAYSAGLNHIVSLSKDATLRSNVLFYEDHAGYDRSSGNCYGGLTPAAVEAAERMKQRTLRIVPVLKYEENSRKRYFSDELRCSFGRQSSGDQVVTNGIGVTEQTRISPSYVRNYLSSSFRMGRNLLQIRSLLRYAGRGERLETVSDSLPLYNTAERFTTRSAMTRNVVTGSFPVLGNDLELSLQTYYRDNTYNAHDDIRHRTFRLQGTSGYTWKYGRESFIAVELPVEWTRSSLVKKDGRPSVRHFVAFEPDISLRQMLGDRLSVSLSASLSTEDNALGFYARRPLREGYRTVQVTGDDIYKSTKVHTSFRLRYRDLATMLFASLSLVWSDTRREAFSHFEYSDSLTVMTWEKGGNHRRNTMVSAMVDKTFTSVGLSLKAEATYDRTGFLVSQSGMMVDNRSHHSSGTLTATFQKLSWLRFSTAFTAGCHWERSSMSRSDVLASYITHAALYLFPTKRTELKWKLYDLTNEVTKGHFHACGLLDADFNYKINSVCELGLTGTNLLNSTSYVITQESGLNRFSSTLPLRGREILLRLQWRL